MGKTVINAIGRVGGSELRVLIEHRFGTVLRTTEAAEIGVVSRTSENHDLVLRGRAIRTHQHYGSGENRHN